jgi:predicted AlkP superfamily pyrophosphatase or phosphodiesterase
MHTLARFLLIALLGILAPFAAQAAQPVTILISIDGFRPDYLERGVTPTLFALAEGGVSAAMRPSFPTKTFPNHWAIVTGATPDRSGIVANRMEDPRRPGEVFTMASADPFWWNEAEPIWVTAERAGQRTATMFWPGSNVAWGDAPGQRPRDWHQYNEAVSNRQRVDAVLDWLRRPADTRPAFVTLYFDTVDTAGHEYGPDDPRTTAALAEIDRAVTSLVDGLHQLQQPANLVIVSDHGMAATSPERVVVLDTLADPAGYRVIESGPFATLEPQPGQETAVAAALLRPHPHMECWRKAEIPARLRYGRHPRVASILCLAEVGWLIEPAAKAAEMQSGGSHGYDNAVPGMAALFIASGPAFRSGVRLPAFDNVDVNPLLRRLLGLPSSAQIDGSDAALRGALAAP